MTLNNLDAYMNDPDIANEPMPLREVHAIRLKIYDETKGMSADERKAYYSDGLDEICQKFNIKMVQSVRRT
ncbi:MAG: hypothetical protein FWH32_08035 [Clostridiales bacterium]|nr:hypothetical protein [Clostridiales bacterium]